MAPVQSTGAFSCARGGLIPPSSSPTLPPQGAWGERWVHLGFSIHPALRTEPGTKHTMISAQRKQTVISTHRVHAKDSGSPEVQISVLTERISALTEHLQGNQKDNSSRRGLTLMVSRRNRLLKYLAAEDKDRYTGLIGKLGLRK